MKRQNKREVKEVESESELSTKEAEALKTYEESVDSAWKAWLDVEKSADEVQEKNLRPVRQKAYDAIFAGENPRIDTKAYHKAHQVWSKAAHPAWETYQKAADTAWKAFEKAVAPASAEEIYKKAKGEKSR